MSAVRACGWALALACTVMASSALAGPVLEVRTVGAGAADLVVFSGGAQAGWRTGMRADIARGGVPVGTLLVVTVGERSSAAIIEAVSEGTVLQPGDQVSARTNLRTR
jgi:hypothetical protein